MNTLTPAQLRPLLRQHGAHGWSEMTRRYGATFRIQGSVLTADPELARQLLMHRPHTLRRPGAYRLMARLVPGAPGILFEEGEQWVRRLRVLMPTFSPARIESLAGEIAGAAAEHAAGWREGDRGSDLMREVSALGCRVVLRVGYNLDPAHPTVQRFGELLREYKFTTMRNDPRPRLDELGLRASKLLHLPWMAALLLRLGRQVRELRGVTADLLRQRPWLDAEREGWVQALHQAGFSLEALTDELNHLYGAYNAIDYLITCALVELDLHPEWRERVRAELAAHLGDRSPTRSDLDALPLTRAWLLEVQRRYPVAMLVMRTAGEPVTAHGVTYPAGTEFLVSLYGLHHDPALWEEPGAFRPERWLQPRDAERFSFIPFLHGPRKCIGQELAETQAVAVLNALRDWRVRLLDPEAGTNHFVIPRWDRPLPYRLERAG